MNATGRPLLRAGLIGAATGMRSQWGPAAVAWSGGRVAASSSVQPGFWDRPWVRGATLAAATAEFVADKSSRIPSRLAFTGLAPRLALAAACAVVLARRHHVSARTAVTAAIGASSACASAVAGTRWRLANGNHVGAAAAEDVFAAVLAWSACTPRLTRPASSQPSQRLTRRLPAEREAKGRPMEYEVRAEYVEEVPAQSDHPRIETWHMTKADETEALCGQSLDPAAKTLPVTAWGTSQVDPFCRVCGAQYLRQGV